MLSGLLSSIAPRLVPRVMARAIRPHGVRPATIVLGCDEVASAIAHRLHRDGFAVILVAPVDPSAPRRGMSFTDAWYVGASQLEGVRAVFCASIRSIPAVLHGHACIAATTWSWGGVATAFAPVATVDTRPFSGRTPLDGALAGSMLTIEVVPGAVTGPEFHVAMPPSPGIARPRRVPIHAAIPGRIVPRRDIGDSVAAGEVVATIGNAPVCAPRAGILRGVSARGARVHVGDLVADVDPDASPSECFELDREAVVVAAAVSQALFDERPDAIVYRR